MGEPSADESDPRLTAVMNLLVDMYTRLATNEQFIDNLRAEKAAEQESRLQNSCVTHANPSIGRGTTKRGVITSPECGDNRP